MPEPLITPAQQLELVKRYKDGAIRVKEIAAEFKISTASVCYYAKKHGCRMRKR